MKTCQPNGTGASHLRKPVTALPRGDERTVRPERYVYAAIGEIADDLCQALKS
jgi:hypothetical protein